VPPFGPERAESVEDPGTFSLPPTEASQSSERANIQPSLFSHFGVSCQRVIELVLLSDPVPPPFVLDRLLS